MLNNMLLVATNYPNSMWENPLYRFIMSPSTWAFIISTAIIILLVFKLGIFYLVQGIIYAVFDIISRVIIGSYTHIILLAYRKKSGVDTAEYRNTQCTFKGIRCTHVSNADVILIEHIGFVKPIVIVCFFFSTWGAKLKEKRDSRL